MRSFVIWSVVCVALAGPILAAANSPLLAWRDPIYIAAGFAGIAGLGLLLVQPLLASRVLPMASPMRARFWHRTLGAVLVMLVLIHVGGLWLTSPPDVVDVLLFRSPTPFSLWGVLAMWAVFASAALMAMRKRFKLKPQTWKFGHRALAIAIVVFTILHAVLIEGTMETMSKFALCGLIVVATSHAVFRREKR